MNKKLISPLLFFSVAVGLFSCRQIVAPEYVSIDNLQFGGENLSRAVLSADVKLYNPNKSNLTFKSGSLDIYVDNRLLGHTELDSNIHIAKLDTFTVPIAVNLNMSKILGNALALGLKDSVLIRLDGNVKVGRSGVFITRPVKYEQKEKLDLLGF
ncbi:MAG: LEA type 2 family protein [Chitinophagaceae bacterium]|nr:LEA type 2 family protein [Chitinophagaceae bacterium]